MTSHTAHRLDTNRSAETGRSVAALVLGIMWLGGFGSIAGLVLARSAQRRRMAQGLDRSAVATVATIVAIVGLIACAFAAFLVIGADPKPS